MSNDAIEVGSRWHWQSDLTVTGVNNGRVRFRADRMDNEEAFDIDHFLQHATRVDTPAAVKIVCSHRGRYKLDDDTPWRCQHCHEDMPGPTAEPGKDEAPRMKCQRCGDVSAEGATHFPCVRVPVVSKPATPPPAPPEAPWPQFEVFSDGAEITAWVDGEKVLPEAPSGCCGTCRGRKNPPGYPRCEICKHLCPVASAPPPPAPPQCLAGCTLATPCMVVITSGMNVYECPGHRERVCDPSDSGCRCAKCSWMKQQHGISPDLPAARASTYVPRHEGLAGWATRRWR